ncbi:unnamed protein product, partial [Ixodes pacificus]
PTGWHVGSKHHPNPAIRGTHDTEKGVGKTAACATLATTRRAGRQTRSVPDPVHYPVPRRDGPPPTSLGHRRIAGYRRSINHWRCWGASGGTSRRKARLISRRIYARPPPSSVLTLPFPLPTMPDSGETKRRAERKTKSHRPKGNVNLLREKA